MATAPRLPLVPVDEYLNSSYTPDMEYVDGVLVERGVPTLYHSLLQAILIRCFFPFEKEFRFKALPEVRTQIIARARYRIPDVGLFAKPLSDERSITAVPLAVIEILSPDDTVNDTLDRFRDYGSIGVKNLVQMDPERYVAHRYENNSLIATRFENLYLENVQRSLPFDSDLLFEQLRAELDDSLRSS